METQQQTQQDLLTGMQLSSWHSHISRADKLLTELTDDQLQNEISPGRNTGIYLLGHLAAVHDLMIPLLGLGNKINMEAEEIFIRNPDKSGLIRSSAQQLRTYWNEVNAILAGHFSKMKGEEWLQKHTAVSAEDFVKEPHRNKLNILISRTNHLAYHSGQIALLKK